MAKFGGRPGVLIAEPEIMNFNINEKLDFIVMGCDGIFDSLTNTEVSDCVWLGLKDIKSDNIHLSCAASCDLIMKTSLIKKSYDNVSCIIICFENYEKEFNNYINKSKESETEESFTNYNNQKQPNFKTETKFHNIKLLNLNDNLNKNESKIRNTPSYQPEPKEKKSVSSKRFDLNINNQQNNKQLGITQNIYSEYKKSHIKINRKFESVDKYSIAEFHNKFITSNQSIFKK